MDVVLGHVRGAYFPAEVLVIGLHLADVGTRACRIRRAGDGGELDFIQVIVPIGSHVPRGAEQPEAEENSGHTPSFLCTIQPDKASVTCLSSVTSWNDCTITHCEQHMQCTLPCMAVGPMNTAKKWTLLYLTCWSAQKIPCSLHVPRALAPAPGPPSSVGREKLLFIMNSPLSVK